MGSKTESLDWEIDISQPVWSFRHIAKLLDVTPEYVRKTVVVTPGFPAARKCTVGKNAQIEMNKTYKREEVLAWYDSHPPVLEQSA